MEGLDIRDRAETQVRVSEAMLAQRDTLQNSSQCYKKNFEEV